MIQALAVAVVGAAMLGMGCEAWAEGCAWEACAWVLTGWMSAGLSMALAHEARRGRSAAMRCVCCGGEVTFVQKLAPNVSEGLCATHEGRWTRVWPEPGSMNTSYALREWRAFTAQQAEAH